MPRRAVPSPAVPRGHCSKLNRPQRLQLFLIPGNLRHRGIRIRIDTPGPQLDTGAALGRRGDQQCVESRLDGCPGSRRRLAAGHDPVGEPQRARCQSAALKNRLSHDVCTASQRSTTSGCALSMPSSRTSTSEAAGAVIGCASPYDCGLLARRRCEFGLGGGPGMTTSKSWPSHRKTPASRTRRRLEKLSRIGGRSELVGGYPHPVTVDEICCSGGRFVYVASSTSGPVRSGQPQQIGSQCSISSWPPRSS